MDGAQFISGLVAAAFALALVGAPCVFAGDGARYLYDRAHRRGGRGDGP
jgi:hypothetical protein